MDSINFPYILIFTQNSFLFYLLYASCLFHTFCVSFSPFQFAEVVKILNFVQFQVKCEANDLLCGLFIQCLNISHLALCEMTLQTCLCLLLCPFYGMLPTDVHWECNFFKVFIELFIIC